MVVRWLFVGSNKSIEVDCAWSLHLYGQLARVNAASLAMVSSHVGLINLIKVVMRGESNGGGWAVTQHGQAHTYSWSSSIVSLQV
jgi:hypothetical protein